MRINDLCIFYDIDAERLHVSIPFRFSWTQEPVCSLLKKLHIDFDIKSCNVKTQLANKELYGIEDDGNMYIYMTQQEFVEYANNLATLFCQSWSEENG